MRNPPRPVTPYNFSKEREQTIDIEMSPYRGTFDVDPSIFERKQPSVQAANQVARDAFLNASNSSISDYHPSLEITASPQQYARSRLQPNLPMAQSPENVVKFNPSLFPL